MNLDHEGGKNIMALTKAQDALLKKLDAGAQIVYRINHYMVVNEDDPNFFTMNLWPSTFYGLYDERLIEVNDIGGYIISDKGKEYLCANS